ncbi:Serine/threonine protein kinase [Lentzea xinjiangensis]|uniref:non-specific serine/threonine protein kinase n=1 Tax=Lentzea xinjiangensis TaxID=402600 RepID=A0A1H9NM19_9PSEU|nr:protein kinase [Lentzea xinjiangensis]SER36988.1 Serine/threonine protein kinase [Lentzea xinjiangensis]
MTGGDDFDLIGTGPVATVYGGLYLALKAYPPVAEHVLDAFERERTALAPLCAEAPILPVDEVVRLGDGQPALQMELCSASLAGLVADTGKLLQPDAVAVGHAVATAIAAAHRLGVVHGGLTPHNVLFHPSGAPVVADFGVALRRAFPPAATEYTAPETRRDGTMDERSDLYGVGTVLHLALTGFPPGGGAQWQDGPAELVKLVNRLLAEDPADRPSTVDVVVRQLAALLEPQTAPEPEPEPAEPEPDAEDRGTAAAEPAKRGRFRVRTVAGVAAAAAALVALPVLVHNQLTGPPSAASARPSTTAPSPVTTPVALTLADPVDGGAHVDLAWQAPDGFTFAVVVAAEKQQPRVLMAHNRSMRVPVESTGRYCFLVQATDGARVLETPPKPIRGATCKA